MNEKRPWITSVNRGAEKGGEGLENSRAAVILAIIRESADTLKANGDLPS
jgi:hypothetical protein